MRLDRATISLEPRSVGHCLDLATSFMATHAPPLIGVSGLAAVPVCIFVTLWCHDRRGAWWMAALACLIMTAPLGVLLVRGVAEQTFGEPLTWQTLLRSPASLVRLTLQVLAARVAIVAGGLLCGLPALLAATWWGFLAESRILSHVHQRGADQRTSPLIRAEYSDLVFRLLVLLGLGMALWILMVLTLDAGVTVVWGSSPLIGRLSVLGQDIGIEADFDVYWHDALTLLTHDRAALLLQVAAFFVIYPIIRIAWYFCYIDLRVRRDCWDVELELIRAARQLESQS